MHRRQLFSLIAAAAAATGVSGCADKAKPGSETKSTSLWYWSGGLSEKVVTDAAANFAGDTALKASVIEGNYKERLVSTLTGGKDVPDIAGIKGEDIASLLPRADRFVDLNSLGAKNLQDQYLPWKWSQGSTFDNRLIGFPIDIGPTALYYRRDVFEKAGLPVEPAAVTAQLPTWDAYLDAGTTLKKKLPGVSLVKNCKELFSNVLGQGTKRFVDEGNHFVGDKDHIRSAWQFGVKAHTLGVSAKIQGDTTDAWKAAIAGGTLATELGAAWHALDIQQEAPATKGLWRVAAGPAAGANIGGSFLAIPEAGRDHDTAFKIVSWILNPENQAKAFADSALFPSTPASYSMAAMTAPDEFFGGQATVEVFAASAQRTKRVYEAPADAAIFGVYVDELVAVEEQDKNPEQAWSDAVANARKLATSLGVN